VSGNEAAAPPQPGAEMQAYLDLGLPPHPSDEFLGLILQFNTALSDKKADPAALAEFSLVENLGQWVNDNVVPAVVTDEGVKAIDHQWRALDDAAHERPGAFDSWLWDTHRLVNRVRPDGYAHVGGYFKVKDAVNRADIPRYIQYHLGIGDFAIAWRRLPHDTDTLNTADAADATNAALTSSTRIPVRLPARPAHPVPRRSPFAQSEVTMLNDPETRLFMQAAWDMGSGNTSRLVRPEGAIPYYEGEDGKLYMAAAPVTEPVELDAAEQEAYTQKILSLNDDMVVAYVTAMAIWFAERGGERDSKGEPVIVKTRVHVNDVLSFMGAKRTNGDYQPKQKRKVAREIWALSEVIIHAPQTIYQSGKRPKQVMVHSRLLEVAQENEINAWGEQTPYNFLIAPGEYAIPRMREDGAMTALLLKPVVEVGAHRGDGKVLALRLGFLLTQHWRIRAAHHTYEQPWEVRSLLQGARIPLEVDSRLRDRFVKLFNETMDDLCERRVIKGWHYLDWDVENRPHRNWWGDWLKGRVAIFPPDLVVEHYQDIERHRRKAIASAKAAGKRSAKG